MKTNRALIAALLATGVLAACQGVAPVRPVAPASTPTPTIVEAPPAAPEPAPAPPAAEEPLEAEQPAARPPDRMTGAEVFARLRVRLDPADCDPAARPEAWSRHYVRNPTVFAGHLSDVLPLLEFVTAEIERQDLAGEYALIPLVESWYRPNAIGRGGPAGMWQMIASTARNHGIQIRPGYDGRLSPVQSTRAALSYLRTLQDMFDAWQPSVMAYNAGEYRLLTAFRRSGSREVSSSDRKPRGLSNITYDYIAKLKALSCLIQQPERFDLALPDGAEFDRLEALEAAPEFGSIERLASHLGIDGRELRRLNPAFRGGHLAKGNPRLVLVPSRVAGSEILAQSPPAGDTLLAMVAGPAPSQPESPPSEHEVRSGDSLWSISRRYGIPLPTLRRLNGLGQGAMLRPGQRLKLSP